MHNINKVCNLIKNYPNLSNENIAKKLHLSNEYVRHIRKQRNQLIEYLNNNNNLKFVLNGINDWNSINKWQFYTSQQFNKSQNKRNKRIKKLLNVNNYFKTNNLLNQFKKYNNIKIS